MPATSEAQRRLLNARFGHRWVKAHHFDNPGVLPARVGRKRGAAMAKGKTVTEPAAEARAEHKVMAKVKAAHKGKAKGKAKAKKKCKYCGK